MKPGTFCGLLLGWALVVLLLAGCGGSSPTLVATPTQPSAGTATRSPEEAETPPASGIQELALLENYAATSFFPDATVVRRGIPVKLYFTRLHREHVNRFSIEPFFITSDVVLPGEVAVFEFLPDELGEYKIRNEGHGFDATLVVVEGEAGEAARRVQQGVQEFALIYPADGSAILPGQIIVENGVPVTMFNLALDGQHRIAVPPFYSPLAMNVDPMEITSFEFTPDQSGTFAIVDELSGLEATLIVR